jgi:hypothetical protein
MNGKVWRGYNGRHGSTRDALGSRMTRAEKETEAMVRISVRDFELKLALLDTPNNRNVAFITHRLPILYAFNGPICTARRCRNNTLHKYF